MVANYDLLSDLGSLKFTDANIALDIALNSMDANLMGYTVVMPSAGYRPSR